MVRIASIAIATALVAGTGPARAEEASADADAGETIVVTARAAKLYRVDEISSGKLPTEPLASSQAITVITEELIRDQGARDAQDLYRNISGVSFFSYAGVTARGFRQQENFYDGLRGDPYIGFSVPQMFNIARVEFLKGPAGMLYGQTAPGGLFNYVTKVPQRRFAASASVVGGTGNRFGGQAEVTGPVGDMLAVRAGAFYESRDLPRNNADSKTLILDGGVSLGDERARLTLQGLHIEQDLGASRLRGVPVDNDGNFLADPRWNHNEPSDFLRMRSTSVQLRAEAQVTDGLRVDLAARYIDAVERQQYHEPIRLLGQPGAPTGVARQYRDQTRYTQTFSTAGNAVWTLNLGGIKNRLLAGADYSWTISPFATRTSTGTGVATPGQPCPLAFVNPVYGACDPSTYVFTVNRQTVTTTERTGVYLLNEATVGPVVLIGGIRRDSFTDVASPTSRFSGADTTYRAGAVWRITPEFSAFAQYATSFEPQEIASQDPRAGGPFAPVTGDIVEGGLKTALIGGRIQSSLSAYRIRRQNILQVDPNATPVDGINPMVAFGEVTSKGIDLDLSADVTPDWVVTVNYAWNDARITKDNGNTAISDSVDDRFANAPEHKLGFWTRYQFPRPGLAFAFGGDYVSERISLSKQRVQPYIVFDGSIILTRGPWKFLLRVDNILDKTYAASGFTDRTGHFPGRPRAGFLEVTRNF